MRLDEINKRLSEIKAELGNENADIDALETEVKTLKEERTAIMDKAEKRKKLVEGVADLPNPEVTHTFEQEERKMEMTREDILASKEYRSAWLKTLQGKDLNEVEQRNITSAAGSAGAVIPTQTLNKIVEKLEQASVLYRYITVLNIPSNISIPKENATADASWIGMSSASTDSDDTLASVSLAAYKLIKTITIDADVAAMSIDAFESYIVNKLVKKMSRAVENAILNGTDTTQPKGLMAESYTTSGTGANLITLASNETITWDKTMDLVSLLPSAYAQNAVFITNRKTLYKGFGKVKASTAGTPLFIANANDGFAGKIVGYPVIEDDLIADDEVLFGDLSGYNWNWAKPIEISKDNSVGFKTGSTAYRAMALADGELVDKAAFVRMNKATA